MLLEIVILSSIKTITIPKSVEKTDAGCFLFCNDLETVIIESGSNLKIVNENCFLDCPKLNEIKFPDGVVIEPKPTW